MTNTIKIENPRAFVWGDMEDYEEVETVVDYESLYKDMAPATTICKHIPTGKFYALDWDSYQSHFGSGESDYPNDEIYEVEQKEKVVVTKEWVAV